MRNITIEELIEIFEEVVDLSGAKVDNNTVLGDDIPVDSGEMLRIISRIEAKYCFQFKPKDILGLETMGDILKTINSRLGMRHSQ